MAEIQDTGPLYASLAARDGGFAGQAYVGVTSTGIFCVLTCPARTPLRRNCRFFETVEDCREAGFRACKRCRPETEIIDQVLKRNSITSPSLTT
ncbi:MAG TPA: Ada metal-binding domain-containing protein [Pelagibacterium sp.]|uniref:Ada metal-binding domain-containing protein n=1 Tax=Pelagibacterium sp. TaxID=1967288 RepID=UPI002C713D11|nr:Ada metal-binding domain-containing protein [Pelagibacterium sp.]HWJ86996.1 Ada metal-binding domain-containing protein [Pelagibacterium sp.]